MKATQKQALVAYVTVNRIYGNEMNPSTAYKFFRLKKALKEAVDFQSEQEAKLATELGGEITEDGRLNLPDGKMHDYNAKHKALEEMECEIDCEKKEVHMKELQKISPAYMETLEPFIEWKE